MTMPLMNTYNRLPISFSHGEGVWLFDHQGRRYLDAISGIGVNALGHAHPAVTAAIQQQAGQLLHTSNIYGIDRQQELAAALTGVSGMDNVFFGNSGTEVNEAAIKLARLYGHRRQIDRPAIVVMENAFHGRTLAALSASGNRKIQAGFEPLVSGFIRAPFADLKALQTIARNNRQVVAVLLEPVQGEGGVNCLPEGFLRDLRALCDQHQWLLMLDEVQTGNGRTGHYFAYQQEGILPDVVVTAKGLGNGVPIGACLAHGPAAEVFGPGNHGSTFGGNPLCCAAALAVVNTIQSGQLCNQAADTGHYLLQALQQGLQHQPLVKEVRGRGLMLGIELSVPCGELVAMALDQGLLINVTAGNVVRLLPPLILTRDQADRIATTLLTVIEQFSHQQATA